MVWGSQNNTGRTEATRRPTIQKCYSVASVWPRCTPCYSDFSRCLLQLVDEASNYIQPPLPKFRIGRIQPERRQQLLMPLAAPRTQHVEVLCLESRMPALKHGIQRVHQTIPERIGINVERRVDEVRHIRPEHRVFRRELKRR